MNTRAASLFEGIANNAILIAHGVTEVEQLPDKDMQIGVLLALLQDDAKNLSSYLIWSEGRAKQDVARSLRRDFLVTARTKRTSRSTKTALRGEPLRPRRGSKKAPFGTTKVVP